MPLSRRFALVHAAILAVALNAGCGGKAAEPPGKASEGKSEAAGPKAAGATTPEGKAGEGAGPVEGERGGAAGQAAAGESKSPSPPESPEGDLKGDAANAPPDAPDGQPVQQGPDGVAMPDAAAAPEGPGKPIRVGWSDVDADLDLPEGGRCRPKAISLPELPAVRSDGSRVAFSTFVGPANADDWALDHDLVVLDRSGAEVTRLRLWTAAELEAIDSKKSCKAFRGEIESRAEQARKHLAGRWRQPPTLPVHIDRVRDLEAPREACGGWSFPKPNPVPGDPPIFASCGGKPPTLEVALTGGSSLVVRVPKVKVYHRQPEPGLARMKIVDTWEPGMCSTQAVITDAWHDELSGLLLVRFDGSDFTMDGCGYAEQYRVVAPDDIVWPKLPWSRQPSSADLVMADRVFPSR